MRRKRPTVVVLGALATVAGATTSVLLAPGLDGPRNQLPVALVLVAYTVVAAVIALARPENRVGHLMWSGTLAWGLGEGVLAVGLVGTLTRPGSVPAAELLTVLGTAARGFGWLVLVLAVPLAFPDGGTVGHAGRRGVTTCASAIALFTSATLLSPVPLDTRLEGVRSPTGVPEDLRVIADLLALAGLALAVVTLVLTVVGLVQRWRHGDELERQRLGWFAAAFAPPLLFIPFIPTGAPPWLFALVVLPVPVATGVAVLQRRLYDIQLVVSRSLTYLALSGVVAAIYAAIVGGVGVIVKQPGAPWLSWVAAAVVTVAFAPLRASLQQAANRLLYGRWADPAAVLSSTGRRLADATDVPHLLESLAEELRDGLRLGSVQIVDADGAPLAGHAPVGEPSEDLPLTAYGRRVGTLRWQATALRGVDRQLLEDVAHQLGAVVHAAGLLDAVRHAQERLVLAREEERRRLRRDLHDGLGPALAGLTLQVDTVRNQLRRPGYDADADLLRLRAGVQSTVLDVRRIVEGLRPPALDELGLAGAVHQLVERLGRGHGPEFVVDVHVPADIPAAVEVAAFRVAQEALTNVVRHASARRAQVTVRAEQGGLRLVVRDDGRGGAVPRGHGVGLASMHERAEEIGGTLEVVSSSHGTRVSLWLPMSARSGSPGVVQPPAVAAR